ncbi:hypothetical protein OAF53_01360 [Akkermansiaceae bacterium]|nr:hypothetical protein [Akkermansiaceae bacterium]MDB4735324.1 hypothetical protein [Akkermansiaceae bacterium]
MKKEDKITDSKQLEELWLMLPEGSPLRKLGKETLEDIFLPSDQRTLIQIDPTRKEPYSIVLTELFAERPDTLLLNLLLKHSLWLARNDPNNLEIYNDQLQRCSSRYQNPVDERLKVADAVEFWENTRTGTPTRSDIREIIRRVDPDLMGRDKASDTKRDLFEKVERIYSILVGPAHRPPKSGK